MVSTHFVRQFKILLFLPFVKLTSRTLALTKLQLDISAGKNYAACFRQLATVPAENAHSFCRLPVNYDSRYIAMIYPRAKTTLCAIALLGLTIDPTLTDRFVD